MDFYIVKQKIKNKEYEKNSKLYKDVLMAIIDETGFSTEQAEYICNKNFLHHADGLYVIENIQKMTYMFREFINLGE